MKVELVSTLANVLSVAAPLGSGSDAAATFTVEPIADTVPSDAIAPIFHVPLWVAATVPPRPSEPVTATVLSLASTTGIDAALVFCPTDGIRAVKVDSASLDASVLSVAAPDGNGSVAAVTATLDPIAETVPTFHVHA